jgi:hypothetical protein
MVKVTVDEDPTADWFAVTDSTGWMKALSPSTSTPQLELSTGWV